MDNHNKNEKVSTAYFFGMNIVYLIPIVGIVVAIIVIASKKNSETKRNYAKAMLLYQAIEIILATVLTGTMMIGMAVVNNAMRDNGFYKDKDTYEHSFPVEEYYYADEFLDEMF